MSPPFYSGNVAVFFGRIGIPLGFEHPKGLNDLGPGVGRIDDIVDIAQFGGLVGIGEFFPVLGDQPRFARPRDRRPSRSPRG